MKKTELLGRVSGAHERLLRALDGLTEDEAARVGLTSEWSVNDALAHIAAWELEGVRLAEELRLGNRPARYDDEAIECFNAEAVRSRRGRTLRELRAELEQAHASMTGLLEDLPEEVEEKSGLYKIARGVTFEHMEHHAAQIEEWRKNNTVNRES